METLKPLMFFSILTFLLHHHQPALSLTNEGFTSDLISIDYLTTNDQHDLIEKALRRSKTRANYLSNLSSPSTSNTPLTNIKASDGDFIIRLHIGTPPVEINGIADTSTSLTWTQCAPCSHCFPQTLPLFAPARSSTYRKIPGNSRQCRPLGGRPSIAGDNTCRYIIHYVDDSHSNGILSQEKITIGPYLSQPNFIFGCGYENAGKFIRETSGVIGLGAGPGSFVTQLDGLIQKRFSYCLVSHGFMGSMLSKMYFGNRALVSGPGTVTTGLEFFKASYVLRLKSIAVGNRRSTVASSDLGRPSKIWWMVNQRVMIDSGSLLTYLPNKLYGPLESSMKKAVRLAALPQRSDLRLCYKSGGGRIDAPVVTLTFGGGGSIKLGPENTFLKFPGDVYCFAFVPRSDGSSVLGNLAQRNFLIGYDLKRKTISFKPQDCRRSAAM